jgi:hypothetical protein
MFDTKKIDELKFENLDLTKRLYKAQADYELAKSGQNQRVNELETLLRAREVEAENRGISKGDARIRQLTEDLAEVAGSFQSLKRETEETLNRQRVYISDESIKYGAKINDLSNKLSSEQESHAADVAALTYQIKTLEGVLSNYKSIVELVINKDGNISIKEIERIIVKDGE